MIMTLPKQVHRYFWDVDTAALDAERDRHFIIERILEKGDDAAVAWLRAQYPEEYWKPIITDSRRLSAKSRNYWGLKLQLWSTWNQSAKKPAGIWQR